MSLPIFNQFTRQEQTTWSSVINPLLVNPLSNGNFLKDVVLATGSNTINHKLSRNLQGYLITGMHNAFAQIYDTPSTTPSVTLILNASANTSVDLYVF